MPPPPLPLLDPSARVSFFCCDLQAKFAPRVPNFARCVFVANRFAQAHQALRVSGKSKFFATEQYPQGLGGTVPDVTLPEGCIPIAKQQFSMLVPEIRNDPFFKGSIVVLFGIEAHVCILQTVSDLVEAGTPVVLAKDGIGSQEEFDAVTALDLMRSWPNVTVSTSESILFQILRGAEHPHFKEISKIVRHRFGSSPQ